MSVSCHICGSRADFLLRKDGHDLYRCSNCQLVFVWPQPDQKSLNYLYSAESGYQANRAEDLSKVKEIPRAKAALDFLRKNKPDCSILDVGCSGGHFLYWAQKRGFQPAGVELNKRTADSARAHGFTVFNGLIEEADYPLASFDAVFLGEIIEHVADPRKFIGDCSKFLKAGGLMIITTPNLNCLWSKSTFRLWRLFKIPWSSVTPPYHLFQFSDRNLDLLLQQENFNLVWRKFLPMTRLKYELGMLHVLKRYKQSRKLLDLLFAGSAYFAYSLFYLFNLAAWPFTQKDFNMLRAYRKS